MSIVKYLSVNGREGLRRLQQREIHIHYLLVVSFQWCWYLAPKSESTVAWYVEYFPSGNETLWWRRSTGSWVVKEVAGGKRKWIWEEWARDKSLKPVKDITYNRFNYSAIYSHYIYKHISKNTHHNCTPPARGACASLKRHCINENRGGLDHLITAWLKTRVWEGSMLELLRWENKRKMWEKRRVSTL